MIINGKEFLTVQEMANKENVSQNTIKQRLFQHDQKPVCKDAIYSLSSYEIIKDAKMGRPPKKETAHKTTKKKKPRKKSTK